MVHKLAGDAPTRPSLLKVRVGTGNDDLRPSAYPILKEASRTPPGPPGCSRGTQRCKNCRKVMTNIRSKVRVPITLKKGNTKEVSKVVELARCLDCNTKGKSRANQKHLKPSLDTQGGGVPSRRKLIIILKLFHELLARLRTEEMYRLRLKSWPLIWIS